MTYQLSAWVICDKNQPGPVGDTLFVQDFDTDDQAIEAMHRLLPTIVLVLVRLAGTAPCQPCARMAVTLYRTGTAVPVADLEWDCTKP